MSTAGEKVPVVCPQCDKRLLVPAVSLGKQGRCPACNSVFLLEQVFEAEAVQAAPAYQPSPLDFGNAFAPSGPAYQQPESEYTLAPAAYQQSTIASPYASPTSVTPYSAYRPEPAKGQFWDSSILGGLALMAISVVWFFGGLAAGFIFFYPPVLFIIGLVVMIKGLASGSIAGD
ncbi:hypothetical protein [Anatilimnocola floriformis]|uniref:hypothetical protein n=1 Tax=Anatilimnocola floriformis TaxID=2948575 RepID=UPI0020C44A26|nr:hypothetical protein [Anatilimnocola floriformis]